jgi:hypothetical protein
MPRRELWGELWYVLYAGPYKPPLRGRQGKVIPEHGYDIVLRACGCYLARCFATYVMFKLLQASITSVKYSAVLLLIVA